MRGMHAHILHDHVVMNMVCDYFHTGNPAYTHKRPLMFGENETIIRTRVTTKCAYFSQAYPSLGRMPYAKTQDTLQSAALDQIPLTRTPSRIQLHTKC